MFSKPGQASVCPAGLGKHKYTPEIWDAAAAAAEIDHRQSRPTLFYIPINKMPYFWIKMAQKVQILGQNAEIDHRQLRPTLFTFPLSPLPAIACVVCS